MYEEDDPSICNKLFDSLKKKIQYFGDESSLHGVGNVFSMSFIPFFKRLFWLIILVSCGVGAAAVLQAALRLYSEDLVSFSVETNYLPWETPFPAVTVCESIDADHIKSFLVNNNLPTGLSKFFQEVAFWNVKYCSRVCNNCKINQTCVENFQEFVPKIRRNCSEILTDCWWDNKYFPCCERFLPFETEYGVCFSFNNALIQNESSIVTVNRKIGLPHLLLSAKQVILIRVHAPVDRVSVAMEDVLGRANSFLPLVTDFDGILKVEQTISDSSVDTLSQTLRSCLFKHERPDFAHLWPYKEYTYNSCVVYCRAAKQVDLCNCTHYFAPVLDLLNLECHCPMACDELLYKLVHVFYKRHKDVSPELSKRGTRARIRLAQLPSLRVRRHAIRDTLGLVVDIGGVGGVFFGASLLSVIEIVYLFCIRRGP